MPFKTKLAAVTQFIKDAEKIAIDLMYKNEIEMLEKNIQQHEYFGIRSDGTAIEPAYTINTAQRKLAAGKQFNFVTLLDEGDFHESMLIKKRALTLEIAANDPKAGFLENKYEKEIYGLTDENLQHFIDKVRPEMANDLRRKL